MPWIKVTDIVVGTILIGRSPLDLEEVTQVTDDEESIVLELKATNTGRVRTHRVFKIESLLVHNTGDNK